MQTNYFLKIWLPFVNFQELTSINEDRDQSQLALQTHDWLNASRNEDRDQSQPALQTPHDCD